jgi:cytidylate kinase
MPLIAMTQEMGSLGKEVAGGVARTLGLEVVHHELISHLADKMRVRKSHVIRFLDDKATVMERLSPERTSLSIFTADEIYRIAQRPGGTVIHGWGATHLLRPVGHALCVRVSAPFELRVRRIMERLDTDDEVSVRREIEFSDEAHGAIMRRHFDINWRDVELYDLALNTERIPVAECVEEIVKLARKPAFQETPFSLATLENLSLATRVRAALRNDPRTRRVNVCAEAKAGDVTLSGIVFDDMNLETLTGVAATVPGVREISNQVRLAKMAIGC